MRHQHQLKRRTPRSSNKVELLESRQLLSAGQLDPTFAADGTAFRDWAGSASDSVVLRSGKILVLGGHSARSVARFHANGRLDVSFGEGGVTPEFTQDPDFHPLDLAIQSDGRIILLMHSRES